MGLNEIFFMQFFGVVENMHLKSIFCHTHPFMLADVMVSHNLKY